VENYFNYFTEIEERFQQCRGTRTLLSPLDWALIESWKDAGLPLEAVLLGVQRAFEKFRKRPRPGRSVNALAYCSPEVYRAAEQARAAEVQGGIRKEGQAPPPPPFSPEELLAYLRGNVQALENASQRAGEHGQPILSDDLASGATTLREIAAREPHQLLADLEGLEAHLTALEEKLTASLTRASSVELLAQFRLEVERGLVSYRRRMSGPQIESLERQFLKKRLLEHYQILRLSLFYL
jgi:hypothetical protein